MLADVGDGAFEEINAGLAANYGWPCFEGTVRRTANPGCNSGTAMPVLTKNHTSDGFCSITGGYVVRDPGLPTLLGRYLYADYCVGELRTVDLAAPAGDAADRAAGGGRELVRGGRVRAAARAVAQRAGVPDRRRGAVGVRARGASARAGTPPAADTRACARVRARQRAAQRAAAAAADAQPARGRGLPGHGERADQGRRDVPLDARARWARAARTSCACG